MFQIVFQVRLNNRHTRSVMICTPCPRWTTPDAPVAFKIPSFTRSALLTVQRSLVAQQSTSSIFAEPPSPLVISALIESSEVPSVPASVFPAFLALTSAFVYSFVVVSSSSRPGVLKSNFFDQERKNHITQNKVNNSHRNHPHPACLLISLQNTKQEEIQKSNRKNVSPTAIFSICAII